MLLNTKSVLTLIFVIISFVYANAQTGSSKSPANLNSEVFQFFPDQNSGQIIPFNTRQMLLDIIASGTFSPTLPPNTVFGNPTGITASPGPVTISQSKGMLTIPIAVTDPAFGAKCDGSTDDTTAIQSAINSLPNDGGVVIFPQAQNCKISSPLTIGNGTTTSLSTRRGVLLRGAGVPNTPVGLQFFNGYSESAGPKLTWAGGSAPMIQVSGPLQGFGIQNLVLDCANIINSTGISIISGAFGDMSNLTVQNCTSTGISVTSNPIGGYSGGVTNVDSIRDNWTNVFVLVPSASNAKGILLTGDPAGTSDSDYNTFTNTFIRLAGSPGSCCNAGLYLQVTDSNVFNSMNISGGTTTNTVDVLFDYSIDSNFPLGNAFFGLDANGSVIQFFNSGSPGVGAKSNQVYGLLGTNGSVPVNIPNLIFNPYGPWGAFTASPSCGTATFTTNSARFSTVGKTTTAQIDATITAIGSCTNTLNFSLPTQANSAGSVSGQEITSGRGFTCQFPAAAVTTSLCRKADGTTAWLLNDRIVASWSYENQ